MKTRDFAKAKAMAQANRIPTGEEAQAEIRALRAAGIPVEVTPQMEAAMTESSDTGFNPFTNPEMMNQSHAPELEQELEPITEKKEEKKPVDPIEALSSIPGGPSKQQLLQWKATYPEVLFLPLQDSEIYVYRYLTHIEWHKQLLTNQQLVQDEGKLKDAVLQRCLLWPKLDPVALNTQRAGLRDLLYEVIMQSSYFISTDLALNLVRKL